MNELDKTIEDLLFDLRRLRQTALMVDYRHWMATVINAELEAADATIRAAIRCVRADPERCWTPSPPTTFSDMRLWKPMTWSASIRMLPNPQPR